MKALLPLLVGVSVTIALNAQATFTTPNGFHLPEGTVDAVSFAPVFYPNARVQYFDGTQLGTPRPSIQKLEMRRRPSEVAGFYPPRGFDLVVILAHTTFATRSPTFANNYKGGVKTIAFSGPVTFPDFSAGPLPMPAPWAVAVLFTTPFSYNGTDDLLLELQCSNQGGIGMDYPVDCVDGKQRVGGYVSDSTFDYCMVGSLGFSSWVANLPSLQGGTVSFGLYATDGPVSQAGALILGLSQLGSDLGGKLCTALQPNPDATLGIVTDVLGQVGSATSPLTLAYGWPGYVHKVFSQFVALDATQVAPIKVALSDHMKWTIGTTGPYQVASYLATARYAPPTALTTGVAYPEVPVLRWTY